MHSVWLVKSVQNSSCLYHWSGKVIWYSGKTCHAPRIINAFEKYTVHETVQYLLQLIIAVVLILSVIKTSIVANWIELVFSCEFAWLLITWLLVCIYVCMYILSCVPQGQCYPRETVFAVSGKLWEGVIRCGTSLILTFLFHDVLTFCIVE